MTEMCDLRDNENVVTLDVLSSIVPSVNDIAAISAKSNTED